ncbi:hypothetical protein KJA15_02180 [Patescibacteria group bacterium]|nr:hypothetical protein [Patescibacteria group bacterium]
MKDRLRAKIWQVVERYLTEEETIHGLPHTRRAYSSFNLFRNSNPLVSNELLDALECAIVFHDVGYTISEENHAVRSAKILNELFQNELSDVQHQEWILYAIANHSTGLGGHEPRDEKDLCLALLVVFDHMDSIGAIGIYRIIKDWSSRIPLIPKGTDSLEEKVKYYLDYPEKITREQMIMKKNSILEFLIFDYCVTSEILSPVRSLLKSALKEEIQRRLEVMRDFIEDLCRIAILGRKS